MKLVVNANMLVAELMRARGRTLLRHEGFVLGIAEHPWQGAKHEVAKRLQYMVG